MTPSGEIIITFKKPTELVAIRAKIGRNPFVLLFPIGSGSHGEAVQARVNGKKMTETAVDKPDFISTRFKIMGGTKRLDGHRVLKRIEIVKAGCDPPKDCEYLPWSAWSACSKECGLGSQTKTRDTVPAKNGGKPCNPNKLKRSRDCNTKPCPVDCKWDEWSEWGACSVTCGNGVSKRSRDVKSPADHGGAACKGPAEQSEHCNPEPCGEECTDGKVFYDCAGENKPPSCPATCADVMAEDSECVADDHCVPGCYCPDGKVMKDGACVPVSECKFCLDLDGTEHPIGTMGIKRPDTCEICDCTEAGMTCVPDPDCDKDCETEWSDWGLCSASCGGGKQHKYRSVVAPAIGKGKCKGEKTKTRPCNRHDCPDEPTTTTPTPPDGACQPETRVVDLVADGGRCKARDVELQFCAGTCPTSEEIDDNLSLITKCGCCQGRVAYKEVKFRCKRRGRHGRVFWKKEKHQVPYHDSCGCSECGGSAGGGH